MSKFEKLIDYLRSKPTELSFEDVRRILENFGFMEVRVSGSHHIFKHKDGQMVTIPTKSGRKVKRVYLQKILNLIEFGNHDAD